MTDPGFMLLGLRSRALIAALWWPAGLSRACAVLAAVRARTRRGRAEVPVPRSRNGPSRNRDGLAARCKFRGEGSRSSAPRGARAGVADGPGVRLTTRAARTPCASCARTDCRAFPRRSHRVRPRTGTTSRRFASTIVARGGRRPRLAMGHPRYDPHGIRSRPPESCRSRTLRCRACPRAAGTITHLEDEPREVFGRLRAEDCAWQLVIVRGIAGRRPIWKSTGGA